jgi:hypothetical protein
MMSSGRPPARPWALRARNIAMWATVVFLALAILFELAGFVTALLWSQQWIEVFAPLFLFSFVGFLASLAAWLAVIFVAYLRYSLRTLMLVVLSAGLCVALLTGPFAYAVQVAGAMGLSVVVVLVVLGIGKFDPPTAPRPDPPWRGPVPQSGEGTERKGARERREPETEGRQG